MEPILIVGIVIFTGFIVGELATKLRLPKVTGYILAGLALNPKLTHFIPESFVDHTTLVTNIALSFITFSVGGTLFLPKIRSLGKSIVYITLFEAEFAFLFVAAFFIFFGPMLVPQSGLGYATFFVPLALLMGSLASPTDPSATLAVEHEYHATGEVTSTIMGVAAFDDILGIINYSVAVSIAGLALMHQTVGFDSIMYPVIKILGAVANGILFGFILNKISALIGKESEGVLITLIIGLLAICYGVAGLVGADELLSTMTMGVVVVNYNVNKEKIFQILERYTEELIFVLFFTISSMHLDLSVMKSNSLLIVMFIIFRALGKWSGAFAGGKLSKSSPKVQKFTAGGLISQGGIVIGLALVIRQNPAFASLSDIILNVVIGATIIHEIVGPLASKFVLTKAGEITGNQY